MARITKDPEERKREIIETAMMLFNQKGFEQTAVSDIVKKIGVAQGTFYYYFKSKEDLLDQVLQYFNDILIESIENIVNNSELNALEKLEQAISIFFTIGKDQDGPVFEYVHEDKNALMHQKFSEQVIKELSPLLLKIIEEGKAQGVFNSEYQEEALEILLNGSIDYIHKYYFLSDKDIYSRKIEALVDTFERLFGAPKGSIEIKLVDF